MVRKSHGWKSRHTRSTFNKGIRKGMPGLGCYLINYEVGNKVDIIINPSIQKGQPHYKFQGRTGTIIEKRGRAYMITFKVGGKEMFILARPEHIRLNHSS